PRRGEPCAPPRAGASPHVPRGGVPCPHLRRRRNNLPYLSANRRVELKLTQDWRRWEGVRGLLSREQLHSALAPRQFGLVAVLCVLRVDGTHFELCTLLGKRRVYPTGYFGLRERVADRGQVNEVDAVFLGELPRVRVPERVRLHLCPVLQHRPE